MNINQERRELGGSQVRSLRSLHNTPPQEARSGFKVPDARDIHLWLVVDTSDRWLIVGRCSTG
jgi:hypothetical protein